MSPSKNNFAPPLTCACAPLAKPRTAPDNATAKNVDVLMGVFPPANGASAHIYSVEHYRAEWRLERGPARNCRASPVGGPAVRDPEARPARGPGAVDASPAV